jgi:hypothetical protein
MDVNWIQLDQDRDHWRDSVNTTMNIRVSKNGGLQQFRHGDKKQTLIIAERIKEFDFQTLHF